MKEQKKLSTAEIAETLARLDRAARFSRMKALIELMASSAFMLFGLLIVMAHAERPTIGMGLLLSMPKMALATVAAMNGVSWLLWLTVQARALFFRGTLDHDVKTVVSGSMALTEEAVEVAAYGLHRLKRRERFLDFIVAWQFVLLSVVVVATLFA